MRLTRQAIEHAQQRLRDIESELSKLNDAEENIRQKHNDAKQKVLDRIMFSDAEAALEAIEKFAASV